MKQSEATVSNTFNHPTDINLTEEVQFQWFAPQLPALQRAILISLAYADIFDYPLTETELHRYLYMRSESPQMLKEGLRASDQYHRLLSTQNGYYALAGREEVVTIREHRAQNASRLWPKAIQYGYQLAGLPFVRMVAVTGALAVNNSDPDTDIDYLIVTEPGRLWLCRAWTIVLVRLAGLRGDEVCPNYFITTESLAFDDQSLYTAHELAQMIPLTGGPIYRQLRAQNSWSSRFLPNADGAARSYLNGRQSRYRWARVAEWALMQPPGGWIESWEQTRKIQKFTQSGSHSSETAFSAQRCKGHFDNHGASTNQKLTGRLRALQDQLR